MMRIANLPQTRLQRLIAAFALTLALLPLEAAAAPKYLPPELDYKTHCAVAASPAVALDRDWTTWSGDPVTNPARDLLALSSEYARGSERVKQSPETALRILSYLEHSGGIDPARLDRAIGRAILRSAPDATALHEAENRLLRALAEGASGAALDLAELYAVSGPAALRNPGKARQYAQRAAASGDPDGKVLFARLLGADPAIAPAQKSFAAETALLALIEAVSKGNCRYLATIGTMYLRGDLVELDGDVGVAWLERAAEIGQPRIAEWLGSLLTSRLVAHGDFRLAMDYTEIAARAGSPTAALAVGKAYATGILRPLDLKQARPLLETAGRAGLRDADIWLARIARGDFGTAPDRAAALNFYRRALAASRFDPDLGTEYALLLLTEPASPAEQDEARELLQKAALAGSGTAAAKLGDLLLADARRNPAEYAEAEKILRLAADLGRSDSARALSKFYLCGGPRFSPERAAVWREHAAALGSSSQMFDTGVELWERSDAADQEDGANLLLHAASRGDPNSIAFLIAQSESGRAAPSGDPEMAAHLQRFAEGSNDPELRRRVELELASDRLALAGGGADAVRTMVAKLDELIGNGQVEASLVKAQVLKDFGEASPETLSALYRPGAEAGLSKPMRELGLALLADPHGDGTAARDWLQRAAAAGDVKAALRLIDLNGPTAFADITVIGASGTVCSVDAMVAVARALAKTSDPAAPATATKWLQTAAAAAGERLPDQLRVANAYLDGVAGPDGVGNAEAILQRAAQLGNPQARLDLADGHLRGVWPDANFAEARSLLTQMADAGNSQAATKLLKAVADRSLAATAPELTLWIQRAGPDVGDAGKTLFKLTRLAEEGALGEIDPAVRQQWLHQAAEQGDPDAMMRLYRAFASGIGVTASSDTAASWLMKAARTGDPEAAKELSAAYAVGFGVPLDSGQAAFWSDRAEAVN